MVRFFNWRYQLQWLLCVLSFAHDKLQRTLLYDSLATLLLTTISVFLSLHQQRLLLTETHFTFLKMYLYSVLKMCDDV